MSADQTAPLYVAGAAAAFIIVLFIREFFFKSSGLKPAKRDGKADR